jgi:hypothetical protein
MAEGMSADEFEAYLSAHRKAFRGHYYALRRGLVNAPGLVKYAYQRLTRGWDDRSAWDVREHLTRTLGAQLVRLADTSHGYPVGVTDIRFIPDEPADDESYAFWIAEVRAAGEALLAYHAAFDAPDWDGNCEPARAALRWVADHLDELWD